MRHIVLLLTFLFLKANELLVTIPNGKLQGDTDTNANGEEFIKFLGVPYGKPPIGHLRFKAPEPAENWQGILDATKDGDPCYSRDILFDPEGALGGSENCLILNVFTRQLNPNNLKPVMFFIHGGGFTMGSSRTDMLGPGLLLTEDIVLVTINYRLGALGFLHSDDPTLDIPGNAGLKDQNLALKWVRDNISYFGGDPNNVTIFGESAGAASVHFHILSPASTGLFHKAIMQSGDVFQSWAFGAKCNIQNLIKALGKNVKNDREALEILKRIPVEELCEAQEKVPDYLIQAALIRPFSPVIEKPNPTAFLTKEPVAIILSGEQNQVPIMLGYTSDEGILVEIMEDALPGSTTIDDEKLRNSLPWQNGVNRGSKEETEIVNKIKEIYFKNNSYTKENIYSFYTDSLFLSGLLETIKLHLKTGTLPIYFYRMSVDSKINFFKNLKKWDIKGVCHGDDLGYLFTSSVNPKIEPGTLEDISYKRFVRLWTNFAKTGNPTPSSELKVIWKQVTNSNKVEHLDIGEKLVTKENPEPERTQLWREVYAQYQFLGDRTGRNFLI